MKKRRLNKDDLLKFVLLNCGELYAIVDQVLDDTVFNRKTKEQISLTKEMIKKSIMDQPNYQNETTKVN